MPAFALNHMTVARMSFAELVEAATRLGCVGVELRNDLPGPLFDGMAPEAAGALLRERGLRLLSLAEVKRFNDWSGERERAARELMAVARAAGSEAVSLIPRNDSQGMGNGERQAQLRVALKALGPMLEDHGLIGMIEPLGFASCALRFKSEAVAAIEGLGMGARFRLVHDTFHHHLAGDGPIHPHQTGIVHVSGVIDPRLEVEEMQDGHRVLVDDCDRLGNLEQLRRLAAAGWRGPVSFECFAPEVHGLADPVAAIGRSMAFIRSEMAVPAA